MARKKDRTLEYVAWGIGLGLAAWIIKQRQDEADKRLAEARAALVPVIR